MAITTESYVGEIDDDNINTIYYLLANAKLKPLDEAECAYEGIDYDGYFARADGQTFIFEYGPNAIFVAVKGPAKGDRREYTIEGSRLFNEVELAERKAAEKAQIFAAKKARDVKARLATAESKRAAAREVEKARKFEAYRASDTCPINAAEILTLLACGEFRNIADTSYADAFGGIEGDAFVFEYENFDDGPTDYLIVVDITPNNGSCVFVSASDGNDWSLKLPTDAALV
jgi:hypothetical protein